jgi:hypothetical protein
LCFNDEKVEQSNYDNFNVDNLFIYSSHLDDNLVIYSSHYDNDKVAIDHFYCDDNLTIYSSNYDNDKIAIDQSNYDYFSSTNFPSSISIH